jgi:hypothetical protein
MHDVYVVRDRDDASATLQTGGSVLDHGARGAGRRVADLDVHL